MITKAGGEGNATRRSAAGGSGLKHGFYSIKAQDQGLKKPPQIRAQITVWSFSAPFHTSKT